MSGWIVLLNGGGKRYAYGPLQDAEHAGQFAAFMTRQVDPAEVVMLVDPTHELLAYAQRADGAVRPLHWPPSVGDVWQDRNGIRWVCTVVGQFGSFLVALGQTADDNAEEIWRLHGPMTRVSFVAPTENDEAPF